MKITMAAAVLVLVASSAAAQGQAVNCGLLTTAQARGLNCALGAPLDAVRIVGPADYPAVDFDRLVPGAAVPGAAGYVFNHVAGRGWVVEAAPAAGGTPIPTQFDDDCRDLNPYADPARAAECSARPLGPDAIPSFLVGYVYAMGYSSQKARVLAVGQDVDGVPFVVFRWLPESGNEGLIVQRTPAAPGGATNWTLIGR